MKKLPIGIQNLNDIINDGYIYVDKTPIALDLINTGKYFFLSRPRRFGKSLFLDTLKEIFEGNQKLFEGLYIHDKWNFEQANTVLRIDFSGGFQGPLTTLNRKIRFTLKSVERDLKLKIETEDAVECFQELIW